MGKKVIITGATGMVGKGVLLECLDHKEISEVLIIGRTPIDHEHPKLQEIIHHNFTDFSAVKSQLNGYDACYFCLGVSAGGMKEVDYKIITHDYTLELANLLYSLNTDLTFIYVSGEGTDSSEKARMMWARVKGKTENDLLNIGFKQSFMFRPGAIIPLRGIRSKTPLYQFFLSYFGWLLKLIKALAPNSVVNTTQIGLSMINASLFGYNKTIVRPVDINKLAEL